MNEGNRNEAPVEAARGPFPWQRGWSLFKAIWPQLVYISMAAIAIPQYLVYWTSAFRAARTVQEIQTLNAPDFFSLLNKVESFSLYSIVELAVAGILALWGYLAWVTAAFTHLDGHKVATLPVLKQSLRLLPKWVLTFLLFGILLFMLIFLTAAGSGFGIISQLLLITVCVVGAAAPVLLVMNPRIGQAVGGSLRMEYTRGSGMTRWSAYFVLLTYEMLLLGSLSLVGAGVHALNHLDNRLGLPRSAWFVTNDAFPFGIVPMLTEGLGTVLSAILFAIFAIMTTSFVSDLKRIGRIRSTIEIRV
ncbi:hypothetical protein [Oligoflexus tunisiensis]|uniref:hypothetical protein n=1 Tax=Oligoflexus tunisiensis TaxID=708132 RepID=UPI001C40241F|nr:hypothetical protein [Oligoflexus tunisiensis]